MAITFTSDTVVVDSWYVTFEDLYRYGLAAGSKLVSKLGSAYLIDANIVLKDGASLVDNNKTITVTGQYFDVRAGCLLMLGSKYSNTRTAYGCTLTMTNPLLEYGFGGLDPKNSGNVCLYGSRIDAYCYWSFFKGDNLVDIIDCTIDGFGRVAGINSAIRNTTFKRAHGKYGAMLNSGTIAAYTGISVLSVDPYTIGDDLPDLSNLFTIDMNSGDGDVDIYYGKAYEYSNLLSVLDNTANKPVTLYGTEVINGYNITRADPNKNNFTHKLKFKPIVQNTDGVRLSQVPITIKNALGEVEYTGVTDTNGMVDVWVTRYRDLAGPTPGELLTPHKVTVSYNGEEITSVFQMDRNLEDFPLVLHPQLTIDNTAIAGIVAIEVQKAIDALALKTAAMNEDIKTIIMAVSDKIVIKPSTIKLGDMNVSF